MTFKTFDQGPFQPSLGQGNFLVNTQISLDGGHYIVTAQIFPFDSRSLNCLGNLWLIMASVCVVSESPSNTPLIRAVIWAKPKNLSSTPPV